MCSNLHSIILAHKISNCRNKQYLELHIVCIIANVFFREDDEEKEFMTQMSILLPRVVQNLNIQISLIDIVFHNFEYEL